ncbi:PAS domain-containing sensor histidine kinase [Roseobacter sp. HKCCA0434]|uniref:sensor histidine kinase NtrY-like n=1 Tax=Roseobacter sp. HKCCA0434 TaxID=3079297 RepID=UPI0029058736|nr:PAS domain-containing sensor histidine kinase [Roseobacter sp. HKCCA0434]
MSNRRFWLRAMSRVETWRRRRAVRSTMTFLIVALGPVLAFATWAAFDGIGSSTSDLLRLVLTLDLVYIIALAGLVAHRIAGMVAARRARSAGSRLHSRLTTVFAIVALGPTILVAVFAAITVNFGLEGWFSERVQRVVGNSFAAAQAYETEHRENLVADAQLLADYLDRNKARYPLITPAELRELLSAGQAQMQRELAEAYIIDGAAQLQARGNLSYLFGYEPPTPALLDTARVSGDPVIIEDWEASEFRALIHLGSFADRYLYVTRNVDGKILELLDETQSTVMLYRQLETDRGELLFEFALIYLGFALIVVLAAIWLAFWFADRLSRPVARLAGAAAQVGSGNFDMRVKEESGEDEIAMLGRAFNRMTAQVKRQRDALVAAGAESEQARQLFETVLSGVSAGVIGLDPDGRVEVANDAVFAILGLERGALDDRPLAEAIPEFEAPFRKLLDEGRDSVQVQIALETPNREEQLLVRIARHRLAGGRDGFVVTFDAITDLMSAQRMAAWGDVARRIAHEIKNPLTPIQLAAERMKRKYGRKLDEDDAAGLAQYSDVIVRQTGDLRRIVDEFSQFARMPEPRKAPADLVKLVRDAVLLRQNGPEEVAIVSDLPPGPVMIDADETMLDQALNNLLKNAAEAIETRVEKTGDAVEGRIRVSLDIGDGTATLRLTDNGVGLPEGPAERLFEPYVTHRDKGTGLGLPIVRKIVEEHGGTLVLQQAGADAPEPGQGAEAVLVLPLIDGAGRTELASETEHA